MVVEFEHGFVKGHPAIRSSRPGLFFFPLPSLIGQRRFGVRNFWLQIVAPITDTPICGGACATNTSPP